MMRIAILLLAVACQALPAGAVDIVRCTTRDGDVRYQDRPCATGEVAQAIRLVDDMPRATTPAPVADGAPAQTDTDAPSAARIADAPAPVERMPGSWLCRRDDGSRYLSDSGIGERRAVPLAMLGVPSRNLGEAYGRDGAGVSAPEVSRPGVDRSAGAALGAAYTWVEDSCQPVSGAEVCRFLDDELEAAHKRLRYAFSDTAAGVRADIERLRERAAPCR